ncbi:MAG TPA: hypothetical protein VEL07_11065 [Planctomycetota bacterium]|nr:hypothetical protein [Planctomycetota bacterium]
MDRLAAILVAVLALLASGWDLAPRGAFAAAPSCCCAAPSGCAACARPDDGCGCKLTPLPPAPVLAIALPANVDLPALAPTPPPMARLVPIVVRRAPVAARGRDPPDQRRCWLSCRRILV